MYGFSHSSFIHSFIHSFIRWVFVNQVQAFKLFSNLILQISLMCAYNFSSLCTNLSYNMQSLSVIESHAVRKFKQWPWQYWTFVFCKNDGGTFYRYSVNVSEYRRFALVSDERLCMLNWISCDNTVQLVLYLLLFKFVCISRNVVWKVENEHIW
jgi:hypothetical protein